MTERFGTAEGRPPSLNAWSRRGRRATAGTRVLFAAALCGLGAAGIGVLAREAPPGKLGRGETSPADPVAPVDPQALRAEIAALRAEEAPWRKIPWRTCLLEALAAARREDKPALAWVFIDRPVDDRRC